MTQVEYLTDIIKTSQYGNPIYTKELAKNISEKFGLNSKKANTAAAVSLKRIIERNLIPDLRCYQKGIYYLSKPTPFGDTPIDSDLLIFNKYIADNSGYESGLGELHSLGLVTQMPKTRLIVSNAAYGCARTDKKNAVVIKPAKTVVTKENKAYLQLLDAIEIIDKAPVDVDNPYRRILTYIRTKKLDFVKLLSLAHKFYTKDVVLKLAKVASEGEAHETSYC